MPHHKRPEDYAHGRPACGSIGANRLRQGGEGWTLDTDLAPILPPDIRDLILERLRRLDATERRALDLIAVSGGTVPHAVLHKAGE